MIEEIDHPHPIPIKGVYTFTGLYIYEEAKNSENMCLFNLRHFHTFWNQERSRLYSFKFNVDRWLWTN